jgi:hypothetical protein
MDDGKIWWQTGNEKPFVHDNIDWLKESEWVYDLEEIYNHYDYPSRYVKLIYTPKNFIGYTEIGQFEIIPIGRQAYDDFSRPSNDEAILAKIEIYQRQQERKRIVKFIRDTLIATNYHEWAKSQRKVKIKNWLKTVDLHYHTYADVIDIFEHEYATWQGNVPSTIEQIIEHNNKVANGAVLTKIHKGKSVDLCERVSDSLTVQYETGGYYAIIPIIRKMLAHINSIKDSALHNVENLRLFNKRGLLKTLINYDRIMTTILVFSIFVFTLFTFATTTWLLARFGFFPDTSFEEHFVVYGPAYGALLIFSIACLMGSRFYILWALVPLRLQQVQAMKLDCTHLDLTNILLLISAFSYLSTFVVKYRDTKKSNGIVHINNGWVSLSSVMSSYSMRCCDAVIYGMCFGSYLKSFKEVMGAHIELVYPQESCDIHKKMAYLYGISIHKPMFTVPCECNAAITGNHRATRVRPSKGEHKAKDNFINWVYRWWESIFGPPLDMVNLPRHLWLHTIKPAKRKLMEQGLDELYEIDDTQWKQSSIIKAFMKIEGLMQNKAKSARLVQGRSPVFNAAWGNICKTAAERLKTMFHNKRRMKIVEEVIEESGWYLGNKFYEMTYVTQAHNIHLMPTLTTTSGMTPDQVGACFTRAISKVFDDECLPMMLPNANEVLVYGWDFSKYDMTQDAKFHQLMLEIIAYLSGGDQFLDVIREWIPKNRGFLKYFGGEAFYKVPQQRGMLKSGDQGTWLMNTLLTSLLHLYTIDKVLRITPDKVNEMPFETLISGDDGCMPTKPKYAKILADKAPAVLSELGIVSETFCRTVANAEFCSGYFVPALVKYSEEYWSRRDALQHVHTKSISKILSSTFYSKKRYNEKQKRSYMRSVAMGLMNDFGHIPMMYTILRTIADLNFDAKPMKIEHWNEEYRHVSTSVMPTVYTEEWFIDRYDISWNDMKLVAEWFSQAYDGESVIMTGEIFEKIYEVDQGEKIWQVDEGLEGVYFE